MRPIQWVQRKSRTWWHVFSQSIFNKEYYSHLQDVPLSFSIKFISVFFMLYMLFWAGVASIALSTWVPKLQKALPGWEKSIIATYPDNARFTVKNGELSTNMKQPFVVAMSKDVQAERDSEAFDRANILVIDQHATSADYHEKDTIILVTNKEVVVPASRAPESGYEVFPLSSFVEKNAAPFTITQSNFRAFIQSAGEYIDTHIWAFYPWFAVAVAFGMVTLGSVGLILYHLMLFFFLGFLVYLIAKLSRAMTYRRSYQFAIHAFVAPFLVDALLKLMIGEYYSSFYFMGLFAVWALYIMTPTQPASRDS